MSRAKLLVVTGGPGAGKTAVLEMLRRLVCPHVVILPEAAGLLFSGGFWRGTSVPAVKATQRAIFHVQREMENVALDDTTTNLIICDRGTLDGLAYWPNHDETFFSELSITQAGEFIHYFKVIHLRTPPRGQGYNRQNPVRTESAEEASEIDRRIERVWSGHPHRVFVENSVDFLDKAQRALDIIRADLPTCCGDHVHAARDRS